MIIHLFSFSRKRKKKREREVPINQCVDKHI